MLHHKPYVDLLKMEKKLDRRITINVGGRRHETWASTLERIPGTRLALLAHLMEADESYDYDRKEFFFDRNPNVFAVILHYYRSEELHVDTNLCGNVVKGELLFWGLEESDIEPCCWGAYSRFTDHKSTLAAIDETFGAHLNDAWEEEPSKWLRTRRRIWAVLEDPSTGRLAKAYVVVSMFFVLMSIVIFVLETHCMFRRVVIPLNTTLTACEYKDLNWKEREGVYRTEVKDYMEFLDYVCFGYFVFELILRFIFVPTFREMVTKVHNIIDLICIVPHFVSVLLKIIQSENQWTPSLLKVIMLSRVIRLLRIFRLMKHYIAFKILVYTIKVSTKELMLIIVLLFTGVLIFSCLIYIVEKETFDNIPIGIWWALVTMTTVGYGDKVPKREMGYLVGTCCVICGVLTIAFTVPIVVNNFTLYYSHATSRTKLPYKSKRKIKPMNSPPTTPDDSASCKSARPKSGKRPGSSSTKVEKFSAENSPSDKKSRSKDAMKEPLKEPHDSIIRYHPPEYATSKQAHASMYPPTARDPAVRIRHGAKPSGGATPVEETTIYDLDQPEIGKTMVSLDSGYSSNSKLEDESRQLLSDMADADRKRMEERRRQVMLMKSKREEAARMHGNKDSTPVDKSKE
ncbi:voltage-gated potassium channel KCNC1-like [Tubulanus polymorphus]|uniref:voltage-gated potassium channel KCNC1-like n=1 Tax=Tubulanus polymorphus TaxID=672921 RepID=UPI003DA4F5C5